MAHPESGGVRSTFCATFTKTHLSSITGGLAKQGRDLNLKRRKLFPFFGCYTSHGHHGGFEQEEAGRRDGGEAIRRRRLGLGVNRLFTLFQQRKFFRISGNPEHCLWPNRGELRYPFRGM